MSPTLNVFDNAGETRATVLVYENHAQDSRVREIRGCCVTLGSSEANSAGSTGNNPLIVVRCE